jgi:mRNA interferase HicA
MKAGELIDKIRRLARDRGMPCRFEAFRGKGSHGRLYFGERFTTVKDRKKEVGAGLLHKMLRDLGLTKGDLGL